MAPSVSFSATRGSGKGMRISSSRFPSESERMKLAVFLSIMTSPRAPDSVQSRSPDSRIITRRGKESAATCAGPAPTRREACRRIARFFPDPE